MVTVTMVTMTTVLDFRIQLASRTVIMVTLRPNDVARLAENQSLIIFVFTDG